MIIIDGILEIFKYCNLVGSTQFDRISVILTHLEEMNRSIIKLDILMHESIKLYKSN